MIAKAFTISTVIAILAGGCASPDSAIDHSEPSTRATRGLSEPASPAPTRSAFRRFFPEMGEEAWEIEHFNSVSQLVTRADLVVVGTVTGGHWGATYRDVEPDNPDDVELSRDLVYDIQVDQTISGHPTGQSPGAIEVVFDLLNPRVDKVNAPVGEQAIFFLRRVGAPIPGHDFEADPKLLAENIYRPVSSIGVLDLDRGQLAFPMGGGADWAVDFLELTWAQAIAKLKSLAPG